MRVLDIIEKKKKKQTLTSEEIRFMVDGYTGGDIPDYQMAAFLMAVWFNGLSDEEMTQMTLAMRDSGDVLDLSAMGSVIDKHSTGGVGDKVTLILMPMIAACEVPVGKMSGRGLGNTGGTIDKLESIPGYQTAIFKEQFFKQVEEIGIALVGQTANLAPADKKIYALRDATGAVDSLPLIAASIMSKKMAAGADAIALDVKVGEGAFMTNLSDATSLAEHMIALGRLADKKTAAVITAMDQPLGHAVGNALEVIEAVEALSGNGAKDLMDVVYALGDLMLQFAGKTTSYEASKGMLSDCVADGRALHKLKDLVAAQGGDVSYISDTKKFTLGGQRYELSAKEDGYVRALHAAPIGHACMVLGGGRRELTDKIDHGVGIYLHKKIGDAVRTGDILATIYAPSGADIRDVIAETEGSYEIVATPVEVPVTVLTTIR